MAVVVKRAVVVKNGEEVIIKDKVNNGNFLYKEQWDEIRKIK